MKRAIVSDAGVKTCRELAVEILEKVEKRRAYADILLDQSLKKNPLSARDRALLTQIVYGTLRWQKSIDWHLSRFLRLPPSGMDTYLKNLLRLTLYQLLFLDKIPDYAAVYEAVELAKRYGGAKTAGLINGVTRRILRERDRLSYPERETDVVLHLSIRWSHPEWLVARWMKQFGTEETEELLRADNEESPLTLRANRLKQSRETLLEVLRRMGYPVSPTRWSPQGIQLKAAAAADELPAFQEGLFQIQGEASQLIGYLLDPKPGERILDACAAPGGKTTHIAELMEDTGEVIATDISSQGLEKLKANMRRLGLKSIRPFLLDVTEGLTGELAVPYDKILVDAPCSGLGTLRGHPEAKWHRQERDIERLSGLQKKITGRLASYVKPGGILVYATCTLAREENEEVVEEFLGRQKDFTLEEARRYLPGEAQGLSSADYFLALPHKHNTDGFFAARIKKVK